MDVNEVKAFLRDPNNVRGLLPNHTTIGGLLGEGGQGVVYSGENSGIPAAIKVYFPGQIQKRIDREIESLVLLNCQNIVKLLWNGYFQVDNFQLNIVATELIPGVCLDKKITNTLSFDELGRLLFDVTQAVNAMWEKRIVHRDIKPSNIIIRQNGRACLIDLGIAKHIERSTLTAFGYIWGTMGYMSPEQIKGAKQLTYKSDLYSLGIITIESFLGRHPTHGDQLRLMASRFHENLPNGLAGWEFAPLLMSMLNPLAIYRPNLSTIIKALEKYNNG